MILLVKQSNNCITVDKVMHEERGRSTGIWDTRIVFLWFELLLYNLNDKMLRGLKINIMPRINIDV